MSDSTQAELAAGAIMALITVLLAVVRRTVAVATTSVTYTTSDDVSHTVSAGQVIPQADMALAPAGSYTNKHLPLVRALVIGTDNRTSTSKVVVFTWTYGIAFGLLSVILAKWFGSPAGYNSLVKNGLREEYWLFLGGTYASAVLAKYSATAQGSTKPSAGVGDANITQLVANDVGEADLGDFQYVLFNAIALVFFLGQFIPHLSKGLPHLPDVLTGLALTSAGGYSAKKLFLRQAPATLTSLMPSTVTLPAQGGPAVTVEVWGKNLVVPADVAPSGSALPPTVTVGGHEAKVVASEETLSADHLTVEVPDTAPTGAPTKVSAVRADGVAATGPGGTDGLPLTVKPAPSS